METTEKIPKIDFILKNKDGKEVMMCILDGKEFFLDFTSKDQSSLREFFVAVLNKERKEHFHFKYIKDDSINNMIIEKVANDYVLSLNKEIDSINTLIDEEQKNVQSE